MTHVTDLPFVQAQSNGQPSSLWAVTPTGTWSADNHTGAGYADALVDHMAAADQPFLFGLIMKAIVDAGSWSGIECGFSHRIASLLQAA